MTELNDDQTSDELLAREIHDCVQKLNLLVHYATVTRKPSLSVRYDMDYLRLVSTASECPVIKVRIAKILN